MAEEGKPKPWEGFKADHLSGQLGHAQALDKGAGMVITPCTIWYIFKIRRLFGTSNLRCWLMHFVQCMPMRSMRERPPGTVPTKEVCTALDGSRLDGF